MFDLQTMIDTIPSGGDLCSIGWSPEGRCDSWLTSRKSTRSFKVLHIPHGWQQIRLIVYMPTQPWNALPVSIHIRLIKLIGAVSFWKRTEPPPRLPVKDVSQPRLPIARGSACEESMVFLQRLN